jgi:hypothetical protein
MDINLCMEILTSRQACGHTDCITCVFPQPGTTGVGASSSGNGPADPSTDVVTRVTLDENGRVMEEMTTMELVDLVLALQRDRVQVTIRRAS